MGGSFDQPKDQEPIEEAVMEQKSAMGQTKPRRESLPIIRSSQVASRAKKNRSSLPPQRTAFPTVKALKVRLERVKSENLLKNVSPDEGAQSPTVASDVSPGRSQPGEIGKLAPPTKAQQKSFESNVIKKVSESGDARTKPCKVRLRRLKSTEIRGFLEKGADEKRQLAKSQSYAKKRRLGDAIESPAKKNRKSKASVSSSAASGKGDGDSPAVKSSSAPRRLSLASSPKGKQTHFKYPNSTSNSNTPSKLKKTMKAKQKKEQPTRSQLEQAFGKRFFKCKVRISRCKHPLMGALKSNEPDPRKNTKPSSRKCSVSFNKVVELMGDTDSERSEEAVPNGSTASPADTSATLVPTRLKKIENGKVVEDIEMDISVYGISTKIVSSTPSSEGSVKKKRFKVRYSSLKDSETPKSLKEKFKLANEKLTPSELRLSSVEDDDEDEYIVPIEMPSRSAPSTTASSTDIASISVASNDDGEQSSTSTFLSADGEPSMLKFSNSSVEKDTGVFAGPSLTTLANERVEIISVEKSPPSKRRTITTDITVTEQEQARMETEEENSENIPSPVASDINEKESWSDVIGPVDDLAVNAAHADVTPEEDTNNKLSGSPKDTPDDAGAAVESVSNDLEELPEGSAEEAATHTELIQKDLNGSFEKLVDDDPVLDDMPASVLMEH